MGVLVGVGQAAGRRVSEGWDVGLGNFEENEFAWVGPWFGGTAEIAGGDSAFENGVDGIVGVELATRAAVGVHIGEDADDGCCSVVHENDAVFVGGHGDGADLIDLERYVQSFVVDRLVGFGVDHFDVEGWGLSRSDRRKEQEEN